MDLRTFWGQRGRRHHNCIVDHCVWLGSKLHCMRLAPLNANAFILSKEHSPSLTRYGRCQMSDSDVLMCRAVTKKVVENVLCHAWV